MLGAFEQRDEQCCADVPAAGAGRGGTGCEALADLVNGFAEAEAESAARASAAVQRAIGDREIVNVVVRAPKIVSIATK